MILPCLLFRQEFAEGRESNEFRLKIEGGTHVNFSPTVFPLKHVLIPALKLFGAEIDINVLKNGYFSDVVGEIEAKIQPMQGLKAV